jgi:GAF domain-containing protein
MFRTVPEEHPAKAEAASASPLAAYATAWAVSLSTQFGCGAMVFAISAGGEFLRPIAVHEVHPEKNHGKEQAFGIRYRPGEYLPGRVWQSDRGLLIPAADSEALAQTVHPMMRPLFEQLQVHSIMFVPIRQLGKVIGVLSVARSGQQGPALTEADFTLLEAMAERRGRGEPPPV